MEELDAYHKKFKKILDEMLAISQKKQHDYRGAATTNQYGMKMRFADIWRKFARLEAMMWYDTVPKTDEKLKETLIDLANYCIIATIMVDDAKKDDIGV